MGLDELCRYGSERDLRAVGVAHYPTLKNRRDTRQIGDLFRRKPPRAAFGDCEFQILPLERINDVNKRIFNDLTRVTRAQSRREYLKRRLVLGFTAQEQSAPPWQRMHAHEHTLGFFEL